MKRFLLALVVTFSSSLFAAPIEANKTGYWGHGFLLGRPVRGSFAGLIWSTYEFTVNQGGFTDNNLYIGSNVAMSTESREVFEKFQKLNADHLYVFEYINKYPLDPEIEDSHLQVVAIYSAEEFLSRYDSLKASKQIASKMPYSGSVSNGVRKGRIVDVERRGMFGNFCFFELNTGGLGGGENGREALMVLSVMDEDVCKWVEAKLALGKDVMVTYSQDFFEVWQPSTYFANSIEIVEGSETVTVQPNPLAQMEDIKKQLLNDPEFLRELKDKLAN